ncbi:MAG: NADH-quinone oxidoreductase subunit N [Acidimicrobiaceae bacterium]|nr:NADH-quinone oxidoreductase subunit N [Acidimicrobiaceae bacterium]
MLAQDTFFTAPDIEWWHLSPILALVGGALFLLLVGALTPRWPRGLYGIVTIVTAATAGVFAVLQWSDIDDNGPATIVDGALAFDHLTLFLTITICVAVALVALLTIDELAIAGKDAPEMYAMFLVAATGGVVMSSANDMIVLFLGLETLSLALYVLAASYRTPESQEAGIKYFVLGGFASAVFLYGIALVYGGTQSTNISEIAASFTTTVSLDGDSPLVLAGLALLLVGLAFKVAAVPFHVWSPDVYQGAPNQVTAFMASVGKAAAFAAMLRVLLVALPFQRDDWRPVIWVLAVLSLVIGSLLAAVQSDVKRMLAYSSVSHAGFILVGVEAAGHAGPNDGTASVVAYLLFYSVLTIGSFAVVAVVAHSNGGDTSLTAFNGLARRRPAITLALTVFLLAQAGVPFTTGFVAKFGVIQAAVDVNSYAIGIIAMLSAVIAAFMYLRIMVSAWLTVEETEVAKEQAPISTVLAIGIAAIFTVVVGIYPEWVLDTAESVAVFAR